MTRYLATVVMMLTAFPIYAQTYKCKDPQRHHSFSANSVCRKQRPS